MPTDDSFTAGQMRRMRRGLVAFVRRRRRPCRHCAQRQRVQGQGQRQGHREAEARVLRGRCSLVKQLVLRHRVAAIIDRCHLDGVLLKVVKSHSKSLSGHSVVQSVLRQRTVLSCCHHVRCRPNSQGDSRSFEVIMRLQSTLRLSVIHNRCQHIQSNSQSRSRSFKVIAKSLIGSAVSSSSADGVVGLLHAVSTALAAETTTTTTRFPL